MFKPAFVATTAAALAIGALAAPATATPTIVAATSDRGLYGAQDPTYDGVYRQSFAVLGLAATTGKVPTRAVNWLVDQQCGNGAFLPYRADVSAACPKPDPVNYTGPDSNQTAVAAMALAAVGRQSEAKAAIRYLERLRNSDGGFPYYKGQSSDTNSTGLALAALQAVGGKQVSPAAYVRKAQLGCDASNRDRGLVSYLPSPKTADSLASAQLALGLVGGLPAAANRQPVERLACKASGRPGLQAMKAALLSALQRDLKRNDGALPSSFDDGADPSATALAVITLASARSANSPVVSTGVKALKRLVPEYTVASGSPDPGALGHLLLVSAITGSNAAKFGGIDLTKSLQSTLR